MDFSEHVQTDSTDPTSVLKNWVDVDVEDPEKLSPHSQSRNTRNKSPGHSRNSSLPLSRPATGASSPVPGEAKEGSAVNKTSPVLKGKADTARSPASREEGHEHVDSSECSDSFERFAPIRRSATGEPQLQESDEDHREGSRRNSRKRRVPLSTSTSKIPPPPPPTQPTRSPPPSSSVSSFPRETHEPAGLPSALPAVRPPGLMFSCVHNQIDWRVAWSSLVSFLCGMLACYLLMRRKQRNVRREAELSLRQLVNVKEQLLKAQEAEIKRLSFLFEKYLSRPLLLRYLPNRM